MRKLIIGFVLLAIAATTVAATVSTKPELGFNHGTYHYKTLFDRKPEWVDRKGPYLMDGYEARTLQIVRTIQKHTGANDALVDTWHAKKLNDCKGTNGVSYVLLDSNWYILVEGRVRKVVKPMETPKWEKKLFPGIDLPYYSQVWFKC